MSGVVRGISSARVGNFLFPSQDSRVETRENFRAERLVLLLLAGIGCSALGWIAGGFLGSWAPRTACTAAATALVLGWLNRRPGAALAGAAGAAMVSVIAVRIGESFFSPLLAWPLAGLVIGVMGACALRRLRARIAMIVGAPLLGTAGLLAGMLGAFLAARGLNDSRVAAHFMLGGAVGFGLLVVAGAAIAGRWLNAPKKAGGES